MKSGFCQNPNCIHYNDNTRPHMVEYKQIGFFGMMRCIFGCIIKQR